MLDTRKKRYPWLAVVLSLLLLGLGQVYCGKLVSGLLLACLGALSIPVTAAMVANQVPIGSCTLALVGLAGLLGLSAIDAWRLARHTGHDYALKEYNRLAVYVLLFAMAKGSTLGALLYTRDHLLEA